MGSWTGEFRLLVAIVCGGAAIWCAGGAGSATQDKSVPPFDEIRLAVLEHFESMPDYRPGDIITRSEVERLFARLKRIGFVPADGVTILEKVPSESDFMVRQLRTPAGREFMQEISPHPGVYDRLERLAGLRRGKDTVAELIRRGPKGAEVIAYFATDPDGIKASKLMSTPTKGGKDYGKSTGRIYTVNALLEALQKSHAALSSRPEQAQRSSGIW
ncbi:MAG TPA: hypothetical protein VMY42_09385 [Thermoguttaceae bacterium]|nr:hypothetical protein [Thermoguttaceae bacterium]